MGQEEWFFFLFGFFCDSFQASLLFSAENKFTPDRIILSGQSMIASLS